MGTQIPTGRVSQVWNVSYKILVKLTQLNCFKRLCFREKYFKFQGTEGSCIREVAASILMTGNVYAINFIFASTSVNITNANSIDLKHIVYVVYRIAYRVLTNHIFLHSGG